MLALGAGTRELLFLPFRFVGETRSTCPPAWLESPTMADGCQGFVQSCQVSRHEGGAGLL